MGEKQKESINGYPQDAKSLYTVHLNLKTMQKALLKSFPYKKIYHGPSVAHHYVFQNAVHRASSQVKGYLSKF